MTFKEFEKSLELKDPPKNLNQLLKSLWYDGKGDWNKSHSIAQEIHTKDGSLVHAYLHRVEGDNWNAGYWYNRSQEPVFKGSLEEEWQSLVTRYLLE